MVSNDRYSWANQPELRSEDTASVAHGPCPLREPQTEGASSESGHGTALRSKKDHPVPFEAVRVASELCRAIQQNPESARAAALRLAALLTPSPVHIRGGLAPWQKRKVDHYVREHLLQDIRVVELANEISLSVSYFYRAFKETFGATPRTYITWLRLELAQKMMLRTEEPLTLIALACGFADQSHLSKTFRRMMAETPSAWRWRNFNDAHMDAGTISRSAPALR